MGITSVLHGIWTVIIPAHSSPNLSHCKIADYVQNYDILSMTALRSVLPGFIEQVTTVCSIIRTPLKYVITNTYCMNLIVCKYSPLFVATFL
jgi:hypothetical protein